MSEEALLIALNTIQKTNERAHDDLREFIRGGIKGIHLEMAANSLVTSGAIDRLTEKQDTQNSNVATLQAISDKHDDDIKDFRKLEVGCKYRKDWPKKNWLYLLAGAAGFVIAMILLYDAVGIVGIIDIFKGGR